MGTFSVFRSDPEVLGGTGTKGVVGVERDTTVYE